MMCDMLARCIEMACKEARSKAAEAEAAAEPAAAAAESAAAAEEEEVPRGR